MRFQATLGAATFDETLLPRYRRFWDKTVFSSGAKQGLAMMRMRRLGSVYPDVLIRTTEKSVGKKAFRKLVFQRAKHDKPVRALQLYEMFIAYGCALPLPFLCCCAASSGSSGTEKFQLNSPLSAFLVLQLLPTECWRPVWNRPHTGRASSAKKSAPNGHVAARPGK